MSQKTTNKWMFDEDRYRLKRQSENVQLEPDIRFMMPPCDSKGEINALKRELICTRAILSLIHGALNGKGRDSDGTIDELKDTVQYDLLEKFLHSRVFDFDQFIR